MNSIWECEQRTRSDLGRQLKGRGYMQGRVLNEAFGRGAPKQELQIGVKFKMYDNR